MSIVEREAAAEVAGSARLLQPAVGMTTAADIMALPAEQLDGILGLAKAYEVALVADWLLRNARTAELPAQAIAMLCDKLLALGLPVDRYGSSTEILSAEHDAIGRLWLRDKGVTEQTYVRRESEGAYRRSPFFEAAETGRAVELWLPETEPQRFDVVAELQEEGFTHYICVPIMLLSGSHGWVTFATRAESGFSRRDLAALARLVPAIAVLIDVRSTYLALDRLLRTYVGDEPHRAILRGNTKRGQISTIRSALLFADMRDSVGYTLDLDAAATVAVFNELFDSLVPPIESRGGEVLKYMGDGLLAIFRERKEGTCDAADRALAAAQDGLRALAARNLTHPDERPIEAGTALHYGEAAYGNVGSGQRLDFTVVGRDVGLASRIAGLNRPLGERLLMSSEFVERLHGRTWRVGEFDVRGFPRPVVVYRPAIDGGGASR